MGIAGVPFTKLPKRMIVELVYGTIFWYNFTIPEDYVSNTLGPGAKNSPGVHLQLQRTMW